MKQAKSLDYVITFELDKAFPRLNPDNSLQFEAVVCKFGSSHRLRQKSALKAINSFTVAS